MAKKANTKLDLSKKFVSLKKSLKQSKKTKYGVLALILILLGASLFFTKSLFIAALVNGKPISRFELIRELEKQSGQQTLDNLVIKELIFQEARKQNITITKEETQAKIDELTKAVEAQGSTLDAALAMQGVSKEELEENIRIQKTIEKVLGANVEVTEDEMKTYYEENKTIYGENANYEDLKTNIQEQLIQEKVSAKFQEWVQKLRSEGNINYFVTF